MTQARDKDKRRRRPLAIILAAMAAVWAGCPGPPAPEGPTPQQRIEQLQRDKTKLEQRIAELERRVQSQLEQMARMRQIEPNQLDTIVAANEIKFGRFTGGFDEDDDGRPDGVRIYLQPVDKRGEVVKTAGRATITLWDLSADQPRQLGQWTYNPDELQRQWLSGPLARHYKFMLPWPQGQQPPTNTVTVAVEFSELVTGKRWEIQKLLELNGPGAP